MIDMVISWLQTTAHAVPLPLFVFVGGIVEELIAPIPSPLVSTLAGSIAASQHLSTAKILVICTIATAGKVIGALPFYFLGIAFKDLAIPRFGKYVGVRQEDLDRFGRFFNGSWKDDIILVIVRAIPVMPSTPISVLCAVINMKFRTFIVSTFIGFFLRNLFFIYLGYTGIAAAESFMAGIDTAETVLKASIVLIVLGVLAWLYWKRMKGQKAVSGK